MTKVLRLGLLALIATILPSFSRAEGLAPLGFELNAAMEHARYGLLIVSPDEVVCGSVHYVVSNGYGVVGQSQALRPREMQVVRIGSYAAGDHTLTIAASGCPVAPAAVRRVRLGKPSPDHGWRAAAFVQASFTP
jgi:hypothetical protein